MKTPVKKVSLKSSFKEESLGQFFQRIKNGRKRKPLRTITELADEIGISARALSALMAKNNGPKPVFKTGGNGSTSSFKTWYDHQEVKKWWTENRI